MDYICYIDTESSDVPFMDVVTAREIEVAREHARRLMAERPHSIAARLFHGSEYVETLHPEGINR